GWDILKKIPGLDVSGDGTLLLSGRIPPSIFVDGKPMPMSPEELQNYIAALTPEMIASIEVIANPSSRYDGEHKAIIDIKLKRDLTLGWKGNVNTLLQQNAYGYSEHNFLLTYKSNKVAYTARAGYAIGTKIYRYRALQHLSDKNIMATRTRVPTSHNNLNYQLGADYAINKNHRVEVSLRTYQLNRETRSFNTLHITDSSGKNLVSHTSTTNNFQPQQDNYAGNLNYTGQLKKTQLQFQGTLVRIDNRQQEDIRTSVTNTGELLNYWKTKLNNTIVIRAAQVDLSREALKGQFGFGAKFALTTTRNNLQYDTLNKNNEFVHDDSRSNNFNYDEYISAAYLSYDRKINNLQYAVSIRAEHTHSLAEAITNNQTTKRNYLTLLPSFSATYYDDARQYHFSYSRKMTRPNFSQLNPFRFYLSPRNFFVGNPLLLPAKQDLITLSYSNKNFSVAVNGGKETDPLARYPEYNDTTHVLEYLGRNLPYNYFAGFQASYSFSLKKWWRWSHTFNALYKKEQTPYHDQVYAIGIFDYTITGNQVFNLPRNFSLDVYYRILSDGGNGLYFSKGYTTIDLGLQKTWLQGKLNTKLNYYDLFNQYEVRYIFREKQLIDNELAHWFGTNRVVLTVSYSFGKSTHKVRQSNKNEEEGRVQ
ncbi:MAG: TonB-dependent receptor, partial [Chitinophagaceae bacterium]